MKTSEAQPGVVVITPTGKLGRIARGCGIAERCMVEYIGRHFVDGFVEIQPRLLRLATEREKLAGGVV